MDVKAIKKRLKALQSQTSRKSTFWKPQPGVQTVRIVPRAQSPDNPFVEMLFHYNVGGKTYLSPATFDEPDPILEFAQKLKKQGDRESWEQAKRLEPKLRTFVPVVVRGEENEGVRWWGFGKTVYQELLGIIAVEVHCFELVCGILVRPKETPLHNDPDIAEKFLTDQEDILDFYTRHTYEELKAVLMAWLNPDGDDDEEEELISEDDSEDDSDEDDEDDEVPVKKTPVVKKSTPAPAKNVVTPKVRSASSDCDDLFPDEN